MKSQAGQFEGSLSMFLCAITSLCVRRENHWKRGLAIIPTVYGISFGTAVLDQAGALVHIYTDRSVLLSNGEIEMGRSLSLSYSPSLLRSLSLLFDTSFLYKQHMHVPVTLTTVDGVVR